MSNKGDLQLEGSVTIPIVDFSPWKNTDDKSCRMQVAQTIVNACRKVGFVYIVNHSLPDSLLDEAFEWSRRFFALSHEDKMKAPHPEGWSVHRGYSQPGLEKVSQAMSEGNDDERVKELRKVPDCKVSRYILTPGFLTDCYKYFSRNANSGSLR
jgi:isopenicillin N synthase-like dioxygenase